MYYQLFIFVEGVDDERFIKSVINPILAPKYHITILKYANQPKGYIEKVITSIPNADYIFLGDLDDKGFGICVTSRKEKIQKIHGEKVENHKIIIVKEEIESWYLAVCNEENQQKFKLKIPSDTESFYKEDFEKLIPKNNSRIDFMVELLNKSSLELGVR